MCEDPLAMRIAIVSDHNGVALKARVAAWLGAHGHEVDDRAAGVGTEIVDYPPLCEDVCRRVLEGEADVGLVIGGGGSGETIACNKLPGIRAVLCHSVWGAEIGRGNNDGNVLVVGAKVIGPELAERIVEAWLATPFKGAEHARRLEMIAALERGESLLEEAD
jgi:ribose 5-phosphate isomerase B